MFLATDHDTQTRCRATHSTIGESDWRILAAFWHPVAFSHDVGERAPVAVRLLDVELVAYRTSMGVSVAHDLCPHRGMPVSRGSVVDDRLVCPLHGLCFDGTDQCTRIPTSLRLKSVKSALRYGIVWACLSGDPLWPLPEWPALERPEPEQQLFLPIDTWQASAGRHVENFNDLAHFPYYRKSFGGLVDETVPDYAVEPRAGGLGFQLLYTEGFNRFPDGVPGARRDVHYRCDLTFPFATLLTMAPTGSSFVQYLAEVASPVSAYESRIFQVMTDTMGNPDADYRLRDQITINREDVPSIESQRPRELPLHLREELHIPADRLSVEYRKALVAKFGPGAGRR